MIRVLSGHSNAVRAVAISPDDTWIATASSDGTARLWNSDGTPCATLTDHTKTVYGVAISSDGTWLATAGHDGTARLWNSNGIDVTDSTLSYSGIRCVFSADCQHLLLTAKHGYSLISVPNQKNIELVSHTEWVNALAISPDGTWLATGSDDGTTPGSGLSGRGLALSA